MRTHGRSVWLLVFALTLALILRTVHASAQTGEFVHVLTLSGSGYERANSLAFSSDGRYLAAGGLSGIYLFDYRQLSAIDYIETKTWARSLAFLPGTNTFAAGLFDHSVKFWDAPTLTLLRSLDGPAGWVRSVSVSGDGSRVASASDDNTLRVWDITEGTPVLVIGDVTGIRAVALSPDGGLVAGALGDKTVRVWSVPGGDLLYTLSGHTDWPRCLVFSPDGSMLASGSFDKTIRLWNMADGSEQRTLEGHTSSVLGIAFSPDGKTLASGSVDQTVRLWQVDTGETLQILDGHTDFVYSVAFSPDGHSLASGGGDNAIRIWDLDALAASPSRASTTANQGGTSDCRACHHPRGKIAPARVIEPGCEGCHAGGISLSWCAAIPRAGSFEPTPAAFQMVPEVSGVPIPGLGIAVEIASPGNGETLYVSGDYRVPETIKGKVYYSVRGSIARVKVQLDITSGEKTITSLFTSPSDNGEFSFAVNINPDALPAHSSPPPDRPGCHSCHGQIVTPANLPKGNIRLRVSATAPDGSQASDERWLRVDSSESAVVPVRVINDTTGEPVADLVVQASTILYQWRARTTDAVSDVHGNALLNLESLSQVPTAYQVSVPSQVVDGLQYTGAGTVQVTLEPGKSSYPAVTVKALAQHGRLSGDIKGDESPSALGGSNIWAFRLPTGPAYQSPLSPNGTFSFNNLPIDRYLIFADPIALARQEFIAPSVTVDLMSSPQADITMQLEKKRLISGRVIANDGTALPFAWVTVGDGIKAVQIDPVSGEYLLSDLSSDAAYLTVSAPGYYSLSNPLISGESIVDFQLTPQPDSQRIPWGEGEIFVSSEAGASINNSRIDLERGWIWGSGGGSKPIQIHLPELDVNISSGDFALENPAGGMAWLYLYSGKAQVIYDDIENPIELNSGEMLALVEGAEPMPMDRSIAAGLHPVLDEAPILEVIEPSLKARLENRLVKAGISIAQAITFVSYSLSLVVLIGIPIFALLRRATHRQGISHLRDIIKGVFVSRR